MAAVDVTITGMLYDKLNRTTQNVVLIGEATLTGLGVGGGPIIPPTQPPGSGQPPWWPGHPEHPIWPGAHPEHPIVIPPPNQPPVSGGPHPEHPIVLPGDPSWGDPHPEHPIVLPPPNLPGAPPDGALKPPPEGGGWGWFPPYGWGYFPGGSGPGPKG